MKSILTLFILAVFTLAVSAPDADARRFGGGSSFGKHRMQQSAPQGFSQQKATQRPAAGNMQRGSARTGMMGMLGGLALGGLLGAMFFGGAFEGINFFDILVIGGIIFFVVWFLRRKAESSMAYAAGRPQSVPTGFESGFGTQAASQVTVLRPEIDEKHFLKAARDIFMRMQTAWDNKDMEDIRRFCAPEVAHQIEQDMQGPETHKTEVTTLHAVIGDAWIELDQEWVAVQFDAMMREQAMDSDGQVTERDEHEVRETWIFRHDPKSGDPTWFLAGIQQH